MKVLLALMMLSSMSLAKKMNDAQMAQYKKDLGVINPGLTSERTGKALRRALGYLANESYDKAIEHLSSLVEKTESKKYEHAIALQNLGFAYAQKGDFKNAQKSLEKCKNLMALPYGPAVNTIYALSQIYMASSSYQMALDELDLYFYLIDQPNPAAYIVKASAHFELGQKKPALDAVMTAIKAEGKPKESWLQFALALHFEMENFKKAKEVLQILIAEYPSKGKYWRQLSAIYMNDNNDLRALGAYEMAKKLKLLDDPKEFRTLAQLYNQAEIPYTAAKILEEKINKKEIPADAKNLKLLAQSWIAAEELDKALPPMEQAANISKDEKLYLQLGYIYMMDEKYKKAEENFEKALNTGSVKDKSKVYYALGTAQYYQKSLINSLKSFQIAAQDPERAKSAQAWVRQINQQLDQKKLAPPKVENKEQI